MAIWDEAKDKSGLNADPATFSADSKKCPSCGSNLIFDIEHNALMCVNCGGTFDPETLDRTGSFALENPEQDYDGKIEMSADDKRRQEIVCNACGAQIVTDENTAATFCAFCGSPALVTRRLTREFKPDYIIPFAFDKEKALSIFKEHCAEIPHLPKNYINDEALSKMTGLYVPTWIISSEVEVNASGIAFKGRTADEAYNGPVTAEHYCQRIFGKVKFKLKDVPFDGEVKLPDRLMAAAEPFDYTELVPFRAEYLQGFFAEKYDEQPMDMTDKIYKRLDKYALEMCRKVTFGYDDFVPKSHHCKTRYTNQTIKYALLPIWFLTLEYNGLKYRYIVNGQTGKVSGQFPYSKGWETIERTKRRAKIRAAIWNVGLRALLYTVPMAVLVVLPLLKYLTAPESQYMSATMYFVNYPLENPLEFFVGAALAILCVVFLTKMAPKILLGHEKNQLESLAQTQDHDLDKEQSVEAYFDTTYSMEAYETTADFAPLDTGWAYGENKNYDFITARPKAEEQDDDEDATDFEKQGHGRTMLSDSDYYDDEL